MSYFEDLVDRAARLLGIVTTTGQATIATETTLASVDAHLDAVTTLTAPNAPAIRAELVGPLTAFSELLVAMLDPRVQIDAVYGILTTDHETLVDSSPGTGSVTATGGLFVCQTGAGAGGYGVIRSRRFVRHRSGEGSRYRFTALFTVPGVANSLQLAGAFTAVDGFFFGFSGLTFGLMRRIAGAAAIYRLTITVGAAGAENMTVTLNGVPFVVASGGALSTTGTAERIAEVGVFTGWSSAVSPTSNGVTVTFIQNTPGPTPGLFAFASTGTAAGTLAQLQAGVANDQTTGFVAQANWNIDNMSGLGGMTNPSGVLLDPSKLNVYQVVHAYLGGGAITYSVQLPNGLYQDVHVVEYANANVIPNAKNPTMRLGWIAASLGSVSNLTVKGSSAAGFVEGESKTLRDPFGVVNNGFTAGTTEYVALALRCASTFANTVNQRLLRPTTLVIGTESANRVIKARLLLNPTLAGTVNWGYVDQARSSVEVARPTTLTPTNGADVAFTIAASGSPTTLNLDVLDLRIEPGDVLAIALETASGSAVCSLSINWAEF